MRCSSRARCGGSAPDHRPRADPEVVESKPYSPNASTDGRRSSEPLGNRLENRPRASPHSRRVAWDSTTSGSRVDGDPGAYLRSEPDYVQRIRALLG